MSLPSEYRELVRPVFKQKDGSLVDILSELLASKKTAYWMRVLHKLAAVVYRSVWMALAWKGLLIYARIQRSLALINGRPV